MSPAEVLNGITWKGFIVVVVLPMILPLCAFLYGYGALSQKVDDHIRLPGHTLTSSLQGQVETLDAVVNGVQEVVSGLQSATVENIELKSQVKSLEILVGVLEREVNKLEGKVKDEENN
jgi:hypothetical protein